MQSTMDVQRTKLGILMLFCIGFALIAQEEALSCIPCKDRVCERPKGCKYGTTRDVCNCCDVCAKGPGEQCGGPWNITGVCASDMKCVVKPTTDLPSSTIDPNLEIIDFNASGNCKCDA